ncbi:hypothetical protein L6452_11763 [Arctium lappa]|uniref:Uncharacterized protein n=1 Tax=Arctium lappa TaxID=4217 RepID=A0ACB9DPI4_ARCLA|nr:hypothetical protein L6452_11763 [Arctium lappa]
MVNLKGIIGGFTAQYPNIEDSDAITLTDSPLFSPIHTKVLSTLMILFQDPIKTPLKFKPISCSSIL